MLAHLGRSVVHACWTLFIVDDPWHEVAHDWHGLLVRFVQYDITAGYGHKTCRYGAGHGTTQHSTGKTGFGLHQAVLA